MRFSIPAQFNLKFICTISLLLLSVGTHAQSLLFDGDFESGTFQGWTPSGIDGGVASLAAKHTCYSANDTTAISFNGDLGNQYAALIRSNAAGDPSSIGKIRSANFAAGRGILFSALSETSDAAPSKTPVNLIVKIINTEGQVLSELPVQTAVVQLAKGCPSIKRDTAFSVHYIDTSQHNGEISVEFSQSTNTPGFGYFTMIDNVVFVEKDQVFVSQTQPIAVAGTSLTNSNILFLDPRDSIDPDNAPAPLQFSWFINGEETIRLFDLPCVNINNDFQLGPGNHVATLYASDGTSYSADTIRFVVTSGQTTVNDNSDGDDSADTSGFTLTTPEGDPIVNEVNLVSSDGLTQTDPQNECDIDVANILEDVDAQDSLFIDVDTESEDEFDRIFTVDEDPVSITSSNVDVNSSEEAYVTQISVSIEIAEANDTLTVGTSPVTSLVVSSDGTSSITLIPDDSGDDVSDTDYEIVLESIEFEYTVDGGDTPVTDQRTITYTVTDSAGATASTTSTVTVQEE